MYINTNDSKNNPVVIGAGISGLAASNRLRDMGIKHTLLEKSNHVGGLTRSIFVADYTFDYTGHLLHLAKLKHPRDLGICDKGSWLQVARKAYCYTEGRFIDAPYQYNLGQLPSVTRDFCLESFRAALAAPDYSENPRLTESLLEYFLRTFGEGITNTFLKPYNEKLLATSIGSLSALTINRFFPAPNINLIESGAKTLQTRSDQTAYNSQFWYPANNGIQHLIDSMRNDNILSRETVLEIDLDQKLIITNRGELSYSKAYSSMPLDCVLKSITSGYPEAHALAEKLSYASVLVFQIGLGKKVGSELKNKHWIYVADPALPFHRVGIYSNFNDSMAPHGCSSLYVEVGLNLKSQYNIEAISKSVLAGLEQLG